VIEPVFGLSSGKTRNVFFANDSYAYRLREQQVMENPQNLPYPSWAPTHYSLRANHAGKPVLVPVDDDEEPVTVSTHQSSNSDDDEHQ